MEPTQPNNDVGAKKLLNILHLPIELQKEIFKHSPPSDLISLSLVSKAFREIAAANLYREFHICFPDEDDRDYITPVDGLASCLDTLVTSDYNYAQFLRDVRFDTLVGGDKAERAYRQFTYDNSCGKFMNTLFLLALRKAKSLERLTWDIRVELSRPVFQALHRITSLKHLHVRLHEDHSLYESPPPIESSGIYPLSIGFGIHPHFQEPKLVKGKNVRRKSTVEKKRTTPPTFSGFRDLQTLSIIDMDTLEYLDEIQECIKNSSSTLYKLKLSFSESLANQSRKPVIDTDDDESDADDPFPPTPPPPPAPSNPRVMEDEKKTQEAVLSQIFGFDPVEPEIEESKEELATITGDVASKLFIDDVRFHLSRLINAVHGPGSRVNLQKQVLEALEKAAQQFTSTLGDIEKTAATATTDGAANGDSSLNDGWGSGESSTAKILPGNSWAEKARNAVVEETSSLFATAAPKKDSDANESRPEDVDIEAPEVEETNDWENNEADGEVAVEAEDVQLPGEGEQVPPEKEQELVQSKAAAEREVQVKKDMRDYVRETRGLALKTLAIYLIPIKASVLSRAIDLKVLTRITLLNVGVQSPFWALLSKENKSSPLPLSKIFTDNVTISFLNLVSELECVTELFMLERGTTRQKVESSTPKTTITKEQIRTLVLRKHAKSLRKLMIKNEADYSWDISEKGILLLCRKARNLEELAVSCGIKVIHTLFQNISGLQKLHALHIISFRAEDTCVFVIQELRRFAIDILSCYPELKLEYIGFGSASTTLARIKRKNKKPVGEEKGKGKGKAKAFSVGGGGGGGFYPGFGPLGVEGVSEDEEEDEDEGDEGAGGGGGGVNLEVEETLRFCEVVGVRIFRKDVMGGRV